MFFNLGLMKGQIVCSSVTSYGIPLGKNIYEWLVNEFQKSELHVAYIFSENYYSSAAALNEKGAAFTYALNQERYLRAFLEDGDEKHFQISFAGNY